MVILPIIFPHYCTTLVCDVTVGITTLVANFSVTFRFSLTKAKEHRDAIVKEKFAQGVLETNSN